MRKEITLLRNTAKRAPYIGLIDKWGIKTISANLGEEIFIKNREKSDGFVNERLSIDRWILLEWEN